MNSEGCTETPGSAIQRLEGGGCREDQPERLGMLVREGPIRVGEAREVAAGGFQSRAQVVDGRRRCTRLTVRTRMAGCGTLPRLPSP